MEGLDSLGVKLFLRIKIEAVSFAQNPSKIKLHSIDNLGIHGDKYFRV